MLNSIQKYEQQLTELIDSELLGKPFQWRGKGPVAYDCYGLVLFLLNNVFEADINAESNLFQFSNNFIHYNSIESRQVGDVFHMPKLSNGRQHVMMVENNRWCVEARQNFGVCRVKFSRVTEIYRVIECYRLKKLMSLK